MSIRSELENVLRSFMEATADDVIGCVLTRTDGLVLASILSTGIDESKVSAAGAKGFETAVKLSKELGRGEPNRFMIEGKDGSIIVMFIGEVFLLVVITSPKPNLGLIFLQIELAAENLREILVERKR